MQGRLGEPCMQGTVWVRSAFALVDWGEFRNAGGVDGASSIMIRIEYARRWDISQPSQI
jgi:hypothetical protein